MKGSVLSSIGLALYCSFSFGQCPLLVPSSTDTCIIGGGTAILTASGSTNLYSWYDTAIGGNFLGSGSTFTTPDLSTTTSFFVAAAETNRGLNFDGVNDYLAIQNFNYNTAGQLSVTVEAWVRTFDGADQVIASFDRSEYWRLGINGDGAGTGQVSWNVRTDAGILDFGSVSTINDGLWHHIAAMYNNGIASIFIDGELDAQTTFGTAFGTGFTRFGFISAGSEATVFNGTNTPFNPFNGDIEEVRIWNTARTQSEIEINRFSCLTGLEAGLQVCISMQEGSGNGVALDKVAANDAFLMNMNPITDWIEVDHDYFCQTCESARSTSVVTITGLVPDLGGDIFATCQINPVTLDPGSFVNYNWSNTETSATINVSVPGTYFVDVDNGSSCFGSDTIVISEGGLNSAPLLPAANDTCVIGPAEVILNVSGSSGFYNWYDAEFGGNLLEQGDSYTTPFITSTTTYFVAAKNENFGLEFDGANDYVALNSSYSESGITEVTVEAWIKTSKTTGQIIASYDRSDYWRFGVSSEGGLPGQLTWNLGTNAGILDMSSTGLVNDGEWHHVVGVYDNGLATVYIDGVSDGSASLGTSIGTGIERFGFVGTGSETSSFNGAQTASLFEGEIDELRIWSVAKSQLEIQTSMNSCLTGNVEGLFAYYSFQEATGSELTDLFANQNGTMFNMNNADWVSNQVDFSCVNCESSRVPVDAIIDAGSPVDLGANIVLNCSGQGVILDAGAGFSNYDWSTSETSQIINVSAGGELSIIVTNGAGCSSADTVLVRAPGSGAGDNLNFDGFNDYVAISDFFYESSDIAELTVEAWIKTSSGADQIIASFDRSEYWRLGVNGDGAGSGQVSWNLSTNAGILDFGSSATINDGNWHHVVGVYDNGLASIYIDGVLDNSTNQGTTLGTGLTRFGFVSRGSEAAVFNFGTGPNDEFNGDIDELRIWNVAKNQTEIQSLMCTSFEGAQTGLEIYYVFNDGSGSSVLTDVSGNSNGTLMNMNSGTDWVTSAVPVGNASSFLYPVSWAGQSLTLSSCSADEITIENVAGSIEGIHIYSVAADPLDQSGIVSFLSGNNYYGVFQTNSGTESYDLNYSFTNHSLLTASNESSLYLLGRVDNNDTPWVENFSTLDTGIDVISATYSGRREVIVDSKEFIWTGSISSDWNTGGNWLPTSVPPPAANIRIPHAVNQPILDIDRQIGSLDLETLATADLNGNKLSLFRNCILDGVIISNHGTLNFNGSDSQDLVIQGLLTIDNLIIDNSSNVNTTSGSVDLIGTLSVLDGSFSTNDSLTIISNAFGTGRVGEIVGLGITGEIVMERFIDAGETFWRYFGSAVQGATLEQFNDDFTTAGYLGSHFPGFDFVSAYNYNETLGVGLGYQLATAATQNMAQGEGWQIWCGDTITGTQPFTWDLRGVANQGDISLPVSFTNSGTPAEDGFCMVSNPYASTVDWDDSDWIKTNMANAIYIQNPDNKGYATYVAGASTNGGSQFIASQQGFWVQAFAASPQLTATEGVKSAVDVAFFKTNSTLNPGATIRLQGVEEFDEVVIRHLADANDDFDLAYDANKWWGGWGEYPQLSVLNQQEKDLTVHSFNKGFQEWTIPLRAIVFANGIYNIEFDNLAALDVPCMRLEDTYTGEMYEITEGTVLPFEMSDTTYAPRFLLYLGRQYETTVSNVSCNGEADGEFMIDLEMMTTAYSIIHEDELSNQNGAANPLVISSLESGIYQIEIPSLSNFCGQNIFDFVINSPAPMQTESIVVGENNGGDGSISLSMTGGVPPYIYDWNSGHSSAHIFALDAGIYIVKIQDANSCEFRESYILDTQLSLEDNVVNQLSFLYDNPSNQITIEGIDSERNSQIYLFGVNGQLIKEYDVKKSKENVIIKLPDLPQAIYLIQVAGGSQVFRFYNK